MKLSFEINDEYLLQHTLSACFYNKFSSDKNKKDLLKLYDYSCKKSEKHALAFVGYYFPDNVSKTAKQIPSFVSNIIESDEYKKVKKQTEVYKKWLEREWIKSFKNTSSIIKDITGCDFEENIVVCVTHPSLRSGTNWRNGIITWGHSEDFKHYSVVYLWHEILHTCIEKEKSELTHSIIELIADGELKYRLTGIKYPPLIGHKNLVDKKKKILPYWKKYLKSKDKNIFDFINEMKLVVK